MRWKGTLVAAALVAAACVQASDDGSNDLRVVPLAGDVRLVRGEEPSVLDDIEDVEPGDVVSTSASGRARLELGLGRSVELAPRAEVVVGGLGVAELLEGSVLARADDPGLSLDVGDAEIEGRGSVFRVDRGFSITLAVYRGEAEVPGSGVPPVPALRQLTVVAGGAVPRGPRPLVVDPDDRWDALLLGPFIDLGLRLVDLQRGLGRQVPTERAVGDLLAGELPGPAVRTLEGRRVAATERLIAAVVAREAAGQEPLLSVLREILDLRLEGAHWIVVLAQWGVVGPALIEELIRLTGLLAEVVTPASGSPGADGGNGAGGGGAGSSGGASGGSGGSGGGDSGGSDGSGGSGGSGGGGGETGPPPVEACSNPVDCVVEDVVEVLDDPPLLP